MQEYSALLKKKNKALSIFEKTKQNLTQVCDQIKSAIVANEDQINSLRDQIDERNAANSFLKNEFAKTNETVEKINTILGE